MLHIYGDSRIICQLSGRADMTLQKGGRASKVKLRIVQADVGSGKLLTPEPSGNWCVLQPSCHVRLDSTRRLCGDCSGYDDCGEEPGLLWQK